MLNGPDKRSIRAYIEHLCDESGISIPNLAKHLSMSADSLWKELRREDKMKLSLFDQIADTLDLSMDEILEFRVDLSKLRRRKRGEYPLPSRYRKGAASRIRTLLPILEFIEETWGIRVRRSVLRHVDLTEKILQNPDLQVSLRLLEDVMDFLSQRGVTQSQFYEMGQLGPSLPQNASIAKEVHHIRTHAKLYEYIVENISRYYDKNFRYRLIKVRTDHAILEVKARPEIQEALKSKIIESVPISIYRLGVASAQPAFAGLRLATVHELESVHRDDDRALLEMRW